MLILQNKIYWYKDLYPHAIASAIRKITPYKICPHVHRYSYIGTGPVRRWGTNLRHSASQFPTSLQCRLHALIMTQEGDALLSLTLLVDRTFTVLDITSIGVILEGSVMKIQRNLGDLQSKPKGITLSYHHISPAYNSGERNCRLTSFSYSSVLQRWEHPIARGDKREHWWHAGHRWWLQTHLEQVWDGFVTCFTQPVVSGWAKSRFQSSFCALLQPWGSTCWFGNLEARETSAIGVRTGIQTDAARQGDWSKTDLVWEWESYREPALLSSRWCNASGK